MTLACLSTRYWMVGRHTRMRVSSLNSPVLVHWHVKIYPDQDIFRGNIDIFHGSYRHFDHPMSGEALLGLFGEHGPVHHVPGPALDEHLHVLHGYPGTLVDGLPGKEGDMGREHHVIQPEKRAIYGQGLRLGGEGHVQADDIRLREQRI